MTKIEGFVHEPSNSEQVEWYTPPHIFVSLGVTFDIDVCSAGKGKDHVPANIRYTKTEDGLVQPWQGMVWCNPPYGKYTAAWMKRMKEHNNGIALIFARTGTKWWHNYVPSTSLICFISGRLSFVNGITGKLGSSAGADSVLLAWGSEAAQILDKSKLGLCVKTVTS
jgi:hypothetical protein